MTSGTDRALTGASSQTGNQVLANPFMPNKTAAQWLNPAAFVIPDLGTYGTMPLGSIRGPRSTGIDMAIVREFDVREGQTLQFRVEAFNVPNLVNYNNPGASLNSVTFGQIRSAGDPRIMQAALKFVF